MLDQTNKEFIGGLAGVYRIHGRRTKKSCMQKLILQKITAKILLAMMKIILTTVIMATTILWPILACMERIAQAL